MSSAKHDRVITIQLSCHANMSFPTAQSESGSCNYLESRGTSLQVLVVVIAAITQGNVCYYLQLSGCQHVDYFPCLVPSILQLAT